MTTHDEAIATLERVRAERVVLTKRFLDLRQRRDFGLKQLAVGEIRRDQLVELLTETSECEAQLNDVQREFLLAEDACREVSGAL